MDAVKKLVDQWKYWYGVQTAKTEELEGGQILYKTMGISKEIASKIIQGEIKTYLELEEKPPIYNPDIIILYRKEKDIIKEDYKYIIETFFLNN